MTIEQKFKRRIEREKRARKEAEHLLEQKSLELYNANRELKTAHDELEARVQTRTVELRQSNQKLQEEIVEREKTELALAKARDEAVEGSRLKSEFLANMSHEIRTPLNAIIGLTNLLVDTSLNFEQKDFLQTINASGNSLLAIINDILDFSRIEANKLELEEHPLLLHECVEEALDLLAQKAFDKGLELAYFLDTDLPKMFLGDITRLRQILVNLLNNAIKFTESGEVILFIDGQPRDAQYFELHFAVRDTGIGIPEDRLNRLFNSFSQVDASTTRKFGGTGLGLAISRRLANLMGGEMWVESTEGVGSTFHFTIVVEAFVDTLNSEQEHTHLPLQNKSVLIVDDNETNRLILSRQVQSWEMQPTAVSSGAEALKLLQSDHTFEIAIIDMQMPEMNGVELGQAIQAMNLENRFPMIMLSSIGTRPKAAEKPLFANYATKPVKPSLLKRALLLALNEGATNETQQSESTQTPQYSKQYPLKILLAEDNLINQKVAINMFKRYGYRPDIAGNGLEAIQALHRQDYDVIFMDVQMPEMDGIEATKKIIQQWKEKRPRIVAMTANAMSGDRERFLSAGMDDYVSKPVKMDELESAIKRCVSTLQVEQ